MTEVKKNLPYSLEVSYVYDPSSKTLECDVKYNGITDSFVCMYDETLMWNTIQEFVNGFVKYLMDKSLNQEGEGK